MLLAVGAADRRLEALAGVVAARLALDPLAAGDGLRTKSVTIQHRQNAARVLREGVVIGTYAKRELPNYQVFDERRYFRPGNSACVFEAEGVKVGLDTRDVVSDLEARTLDVPDSAIEAAADYARRWLPGADTDVASVASCLFTMTDDSHFILDRRGPVVVMSPCSGHGFKFTPLLGSIGADVALGADTWADEWRLPA